MFESSKISNFIHAKPLKIYTFRNRGHLWLFTDVFTGGHETFI
jgi:hypothetical protein